MEKSSAISIATGKIVDQQSEQASFSSLNSSAATNTQNIQIPSETSSSLRGKKLQIGFNPTSAPPSTSSTSYRSQIPGWSIEEGAASAQISSLLSRSPSSTVSPLNVDRKSFDFFKSPASTSSSSTNLTHGNSASILAPVSAITTITSGSSSNITTTFATSGVSGGVSGGDGHQLSKAEKKAQKQAKRAAKNPGKPPGIPQNKSENITGGQLLLVSHSSLSSASHSSNHGNNGAASNNGLPGSNSREKRSTSVNPIGRQQHNHGKELIALFSHLDAHGKSNKSADTLRLEMLQKGVDLHPSIIRLGLHYQHYSIIGSNERCIALLNTFRCVILDYVTPPNTTLNRHLDSYLKPQINFLVSCRPIGVSMGNAIRYLKHEIAEIPPDLPEDDAKKLLDEKILNYIRDRIIMADTIISELGSKKINDGDVVLTYGHSSLIKRILIDAHQEHKISFRVIIVDSRPLLEGKKMLRDLVGYGLKCSYVHLNALSFALKETSKVFMGAHALLSNGYVMSRVGSAMVSMMAREMGIPVITCCETYKFSDRVQLDSFVNNELGDPDDLVETGGYISLKDTILSTDKADASSSSILLTPSPSPRQQKSVQQMQKSSNSSIISDTPSPKKNILKGWRDKPDLKLLHLMYDVTPSEFITLVITEVGLIPCSSVPVVLREGVKGSTASNPLTAHSHVSKH